MGQAGGYQHLPRQLGESIGETGVVTMFTAIVLASAGLAGIHVAEPSAPPAAAQPAPAPTAQPVPPGVARPPVVVAPYVPAAQAGQPPARGAGLPITAAAPGTAIDSNTADDTIVDVPDDSATDSADSGLSQAVTSLPAEVQMLGYRLMWALAGLISLGGAALSWFGREGEEEVLASRPRPVAQRPVPQAG
jgi:hypothetical protein